MAAGASRPLIAIVEGLAKGGLLLGGYISSFIAHRLGNKKTVVMGYSLSVLSKIAVAVLYIAAPIFALMAPFRILERVGKGIRGPARDAIISKEKKTRAAFSLRQMADRLGGLLGAAACIGLYQLTHNIVLSLAMAGVFGLVGIVPTLFVDEGGKPPVKKDLPPFHLPAFLMGASLYSPLSSMLKFSNTGEMPIYLFIYYLGGLLPTLIYPRTKKSDKTLMLLGIVIFAIASIIITWVAHPIVFLLTGFGLYLNRLASRGYVKNSSDGLVEDYASFNFSYSLGRVLSDILIGALWHVAIAGIPVAYLMPALFGLLAVIFLHIRL